LTFTVTLAAPQRPTHAFVALIMPPTRGVSSDAVLVEVGRFGQRFQRHGTVQGAVRPMLIAGSFPGDQQAQTVAPRFRYHAEQRREECPVFAQFSFGRRG
jgi:hypothetical protein